MKSHSVVITGMGVLACNGLGREAYWDALGKGRSGIGTVTRFDTAPFPCHIGGQLWDFDPHDFMSRKDVKMWHRHVHQAVAGAKMASQDAELDKANYDGNRVAVAFGTATGSPNEAYEEQQQAFESGGYKKVSWLASTAFSGHSATVSVGVDLGLRGPAMTISSGCTSGLDVMNWGVGEVASGRADAAVVGATEAPLFPMSFATACSLRILSRCNDAPDKAMRPFSKDRNGVVLSEASVALVLERKDHAISRGARILGECIGTGAASDGADPLVLDATGAGLARAIEQALYEAHVRQGDIDYVQAHGVALEMYDHCEANAYKKALGASAYRIPVSASKSMTGQAYAAGGMLGVASALLPLNSGVIPPTVNLHEPDPVCDLDFVPNEARLNDVNTVLVCAISFGGVHRATVLRRCA